MTRQVSLIERTVWSASISVWRRLWCCAFLVALYSWTSPHLRPLLPCALAVTILFWIPENKLVLLVRSVVFWALALMLIHMIPAEPDLYVWTFPVNGVLQPIQGIIGVFIGLARYHHFTKDQSRPTDMENQCPNQRMQPIVA